MNKKCSWLVPAVLMAIPALALADTIPPGTQIVVRSDAPVDVSRWDRGRIYPGHVVRDVVAADGDMAIPRGAAAELIVRQIGPGQYSLDLESVTVNGRRYVMDTTGQQYNMPRDTYDNGGGMVGAIVGAITGTDSDAHARGAEIRVPAGAMMTFQLQEPLRVANWSDPGYDQRGYHYHRDHDWYR